MKNDTNTCSMYDTTPDVFILCAAIWFDDGVKHIHQPNNIQTGIVVLGRRHHNVFALLHELSIDRHKFKTITQGFITNTDRFVDRVVAAQIAYNAGQSNKVKKLMSENLY